jgi:DNA primase
VVPHKNIFNCFGCGEGGDAFKFVMKTRGLEFYEAVKELAQQVGVDVEDRELTEVEKRRIKRRANLFDVCEAAAQFYHSMLMTRPEGRPALDYLRGRGITEDTIKAFRLGFAPARWDGVQTQLHNEGFDPNLMAAAGLIRWRDENDRTRGSYDLFRGRVMVPIFDGRGKVVAFGGRVLESIAGTSDAIHVDAPKYVNSPETEAYRKKRVLYGLHQARRSIQNRDRLLVVEGYFDVISLHQAGFEEAVATCGTALTEEHARLIRPLTRKVVALFDSDEAGLRAAERSMPIFIKAGIEPYRLTIKGAKDPDEYIQDNGPEAFTAELERSEPLFELLLARTRERHGASPQGKQKTVESLAPTVRLYESAARNAVVNRVASALGLSSAVVSERVGRARSQSPRTEAVSPVQPSWRGTKAFNQLLWLLIHHHDLVAPEIISADPDPETVTEYHPAQLAFALLLDGKTVTQVMDFVQDPNIHSVLQAAASKESLIEADNAANAANQNLDTLELVSIDEQLRVIDDQIATCNIDADKSSYFSLLSNKQALQQRKDEIRTQFAR